MNNFFKPAEDLNKNESEQKYFKQAGDLENNLNIADEVEIKSYLESVVSHQKFEGAIGGGMMIVSFSRLQELVDSGYNIVKAEYINPNMISIEFQEFETKRKNGR